MDQANPVAQEALALLVDPECNKEKEKKGGFPIIPGYFNLSILLHPLFIMCSITYKDWNSIIIANEFQ